MNLSPNGKRSKSQEEQQDTQKNTNSKTMKELLAEAQAQIDEKTEKQIPKIKQDYAEEKITFEQLEKEYEVLIAEVLIIQKQIRSITEKTTLQDKRIENISIDLKIKSKENKDTFERMEKETKLSFKETLGVKQKTQDNH